MILKLLTSCFFLIVFLDGCSNGSYTYFTSKDNELITSKEAEFENDLKKIFSEIDNSKESIRTVEEKQKSENKVVEKSDSNGSDDFFRKNVLQRFRE